MNVVRHDQEQISEPQLPFLAEGDGIQESMADAGRRQLVRAAFLAVDGEVIDFLLRVDAQRHGVRKVASLRGRSMAGSLRRPPPHGSPKYHAW